MHRLDRVSNSSPPSWPSLSRRAQRDHQPSPRSRPTESSRVRIFCTGCIAAINKAARAARFLTSNWQRDMEVHSHPGQSPPPSSTWRVRDCNASTLQCTAAPNAAAPVASGCVSSGAGKEEDVIFQVGPRYQGSPRRYCSYSPRGIRRCDIDFSLLSTPVSRTCTLPGPSFVGLNHSQVFFSEALFSRLFLHQCDNILVPRSRRIIHTARL